MHSLMFVTITAAPGANSREVREEVFLQLSQDESFQGSGGRFGSPICDYFNIGGRWSGFLNDALIGTAYRHALVARFPELGEQFCPESLVEHHQTEMDAIWNAHGGIGPNPYARSQDEHLGHDDDAMLITPELYAAHLAGYEGEWFASNEYADLDEETLEPDFIGRKWLVVIDYHS